MSFLDSEGEYLKTSEVEDALGAEWGTLWLGRDTDGGEVDDDATGTTKMSGMMAAED